MKALSLFSGIGGIDLAAEWAGIETVAFCEREPFCQKVLAKHWPNIPIYDDVCTLTKERLEADGAGAIDIIFSGDPCQPYSQAGQRKGEEDDRYLWPQVDRLLKTIRPRWIVRENVAGNITLGLDGVLADLENLAYAWETFVLPASAVGAPHQRERVFVVAYSESKQDRRIQLGRLESNFGTNRKKQNVANSNSESESQTSSTFSSIRSKWNTWNDVVRSRGGIQSGADWWSVEPDVGRVANGVSRRVDRLKALGNAVVPQQIYPILAAIKQIDEMLQAV